MVAFVAIGAGFFLGLFVVIPADQGQMRMALLGALLLASHAAVTRFLTSRVSDVQSTVSDVDAKMDGVSIKVNGRMTQLLTALNSAHAMIAQLQADAVSRETSTTDPTVSRETSAPDDPNTGATA